jgi:hypothetical protein
LTLLWFPSFDIGRVGVDETEKEKLGEVKA